jgi:TonB-dependent starch-binding outer membrane protein SusC
MQGKGNETLFVAKRKQIAKWAKLAVLTVMLLTQATAQGKAEDRVTLSIKNGSLESVLKEIRKQTGYNYALQDRWKAVAKPVDIIVKDMPVEQALNLCFKDQPFTYTIISRTIVIEDLKPEKKETVGAVSTKPPDGISGVVVNEEGRPLAGATVEAIGLNIKVQSDENGAFFLKGLSGGRYEVEVSFVGFVKNHITVIVKEGRAQVTVNMKQGAGNLDEVQIIAYGTTTKRLNTGDVSTVKAEDIDKQPVSDPMLALIGRVPGMEISQDNGIPGSVIRIQIRGQNSLAQGNAPLFVIDGVPYPAQTLPGVVGVPFGDNTSGSPFSFINPSDIESIDVLKDADATAIYGSQGANGVVLITTKKGKVGRTAVDLNVQDGVGTDPERLKLLNTRQYLDMRYEAFKNDNAVPQPAADYDLTLWDTTRYTDWQKVLLGGAAQYTDLQGSVSGGNANTQFLFGANYHKETLVLPGSFNDQKGSGHLTVTNISPNKKFKISLSGMYLVDNNHLPPFNLIQAAALLAPDAPALYNPDGTINWAPNASGTSSWPAAFGNPAATLAATYGNMTYNFVTNANISYELVPGLILGSAIGYTNMQTNVFEAVPFTAIDPSTWATTSRISNFGNNNIQTSILEPQLSYKRHFGKSLITALAGTTIEKNTSNLQDFGASGFNSDQLMEDIAAATTIIPGTTNKTIYRYNAGFGRINVNWQDKYLLNLSGRRDGSSRFGPANQFHDFYAVGAGWLFYKESFINEHASFLSYGKLRGSYGTTGNDQVGDYSFLDLFNNVSNIGVPYQGASAIAPTSLFNPNLAWEETRKSEAGLELGFLKDRVILNSSYYRNVSSNQLVPYPLSDVTGFTAIEKNMGAKVENSGWEFELQMTNISGQNFRWSTSFNLTMNRNRLASGAPGLSAFFQRMIGHPLYSPFVFHYLGVNPITGIYQFEDSHGSPTYNPDPSTDENTMINTTTKYFGGFQNSLSYRGVQLDFLFQFVRRPHELTYVFNGMPGSFAGNISGSNQPVNVLSRWREPGDVSKIERFSQDYSLENAYAAAINSDLMYGDGSFIRLKNVALSWQLPPKWLSGAHLQHVLLFIHAQNLILLTKYKGLDPETADTINSLPPLRVITGGIKVGL